MGTFHGEWPEARSALTSVGWATRLNEPRTIYRKTDPNKGITAHKHGKAQTLTGTGICMQTAGPFLWYSCVHSNGEECHSLPPVLTIRMVVTSPAVPLLPLSSAIRDLGSPMNATIPLINRLKRINLSWKYFEPDNHGSLFD